jgi:hypothetical protein
MKCIISNSSKFELLFRIRKFPIFMGTTLNKKYEKQNMNFWINQSSGSVQINPKVN